VTSNYLIVANNPIKPIFFLIA